jgi:hypothetical protein
MLRRGSQRIRIFFFFGRQASIGTPGCPVRREDVTDVVIKSQANQFLLNSIWGGIGEPVRNFFNHKFGESGSSAFQLLSQGIRPDLSTQGMRKSVCKLLRTILGMIGTKLQDRKRDAPSISTLIGL